jgi:two-component system sensor histidine kinase RegB
MEEPPRVAERLTPSFEALASSEVDTNLKNQSLLVQLRWIAFASQVVTIGFAELVLKIDLPLLLMGATLVALLALNLISVYWIKRGYAPSPAKMLFVDMLLLTVQLGLSGGAANPFAALYLLQVTLAAVLLKARDCWVFVGLTAAFYGLLIFVHLPLLLPVYEPFFKTYLVGMLVALVINSVLVVSFVTQITYNLRNRDARLAQMREQAAEEDHIVRMGLLASGAAHELGTPLSMISVILSDWRTIPATRSDPELQHDIAQMQKAVDRCKAIVGDILASSGEARGIGPQSSSVYTFLNTLAEEWAQSRGTTALRFVNQFGPNVPILADVAIKQLVTTVLDNALEVSPEWVELNARRRGQALVLTIQDRGPGFDARVLAKVGRPYNSTKKGLGKGVGLFLVMNTIHKLGGDVTVANRQEGGARVELVLPLGKLSADGI